MKSPFLLLGLALMLTYCGKKKDQEQQAKMELEEITESEADSLNIAILSFPQDTVDDPLIHPTAAGKGQTEKQWKFILKNVLTNEGFKNPVYMGVSSRKGAGTILDKKQEVIRVLAKMVSDETYKHFLTDANSGSLDAVNSKNFNLNLLVNANAMNVDGELAGHITRSDSSRLVTGSWEILNLDWGTLRDSIESQKNPEIVKWAKDLNVRKNVVVSKVVKVTSFQSEIFTSSDIGAGLKAKIDTSTAKIQSASGEIKFRVTGKKKILATSSGHFFVYAILSKKKLLAE